MKRIATTALTILLIGTLPSCNDAGSDDAPAAPPTTAADAPKPDVPVGSNKKPGDKPKHAALTAESLSGSSASTASGDDVVNPLNVERTPYKFFDGRLTIDLPVTFRPMTEKELQIKYAGGSRPDIAYTASSIAINLTATHTDIPLTPPQIYSYHHSYKEQMKKLFPGSTWIRNEEVTIDDRRCWISQFRTKLVDANVYNMVLGTSLNDRLMLITFTMPQSLEGVWLPIATDIFMNVKFSSDAAADGDDSSTPRSADQAGG